MQPLPRNDRPSPKAHGSFFLPAFLAALGFGLMAFEWQTTDATLHELTNDLEFEEIEELPPVTFVKKVTIPHPGYKAAPPQISEVVIQKKITETLVEQKQESFYDDFDPDSYEALFGDEFVDDRESIFVPVEEMPSFPGGEDAMYRFLGKHLKFPRGVETAGTVHLEFIVDEYGNLGSFKIAKGAHPRLDREVLRVAKLMPRWNPGKQRDNPVKVGLHMPVRFTLK